MRRDSFFVKIMCRSCQFYEKCDTMIKREVNASLSNLTKLPIDLLKIDKSFIDNLAVIGTNHGFVKAIISMGHLVNCDIISEGVETEEQLKILTDCGCDYIQGYLWGKPMSFEQAIELSNRGQ